MCLDEQAIRSDSNDTAVDMNVGPTTIETSAAALDSSMQVLFVAASKLNTPGRSL